MNKRIKLYVLTGFLGSGKTTFLKNLLENFKNEKIGIIQNEFGKISIDGEIIKKDDMEIVELNRGSIFCSCLKISFVQAMIELSEKDLDYLFVESSGLADPSNIDEILNAVRELKDDIYDYKGAICLIDGVNFLEQLNELETVNRQIKHSNLAIINKVDLIGKNTVDKIKEEILTINSKIKIETTSFGKINSSFLNENILDNKEAESEDTTNTPENKPKTLQLTFNGEVNKDDFIKFLNVIKDSTYRMKGFIKINNKYNQVDVVNKIIDFKEINEEKENKLVIISKIGPQIIRPIFNEWEKYIGKEMKLR